MSRQIALDTIHLKPTPRLAHTEYSLGYHLDYVQQLTGLEPGHPDAWKKLAEIWAIDFNWSTNDGLHNDWAARGRATDMGHAEYAADGSDKRDMHASPFKTAEDVWAFDAVAEYGLPDLDEQIKAYQSHADHAAQNQDQLTSGGYYRTIVSGAIAAFGWEMLLIGASDMKKMENVFDSFFRFTLFHMRAWAQTSIEVIIQHDDFVWTEGAFMHPDFYRRAIIPRYAELWKPLHDAGKKVLFCSDGNFMEFAHDVAAAGADGFIFEPVNEFRFMVENFGRSHCLVGSAVDCRDMALRGWDKVKATMDDTLALAPQCSGLMWAVGNHMPANIPPTIMDNYITYLKAHWDR